MFGRSVDPDRLGAKGDVPGLIRALKDRDTGIVSRAVVWLGRLRDPRAVEPLIGLLSHGSRPVRTIAATVLGPLRDQRAVEPLGRLIAQEPDLGAAHVALAQIGGDRAADALLLAAARPGQGQRHACEALATLGGRHVEEGLLRLARAADEEDRFYLICALGLLVDRKAMSSQGLADFEDCLEALEPLRMSTARALCLRQVGRERALQVLPGIIANLADGAAVSAISGARLAADELALLGDEGLAALERLKQTAAPGGAELASLVWEQAMARRRAAAEEERRRAESQPTRRASSDSDHEQKQRDRDARAAAFREERGERVQQRASAQADLRALLDNSPVFVARGATEWGQALDRLTAQGDDAAADALLTALERVGNARARGAIARRLLDMRNSGRLSSYTAGRILSAQGTQMRRHTDVTSSDCSPGHEDVGIT